MDKRVMYALLGGTLTLIGASVAYHFFSSKSEADEELENDLEQLGPLELDESGLIKFSYYLKILQVSMYYGKKQF
jgi:multisubunit Na+/H+ antiporter MnhB subunit